MRRLSIALISAISTLAVTQAGFAADMSAPVKAPSVPIAAPAPVRIWTGAYIGANIGWAWQNADSTYTGLTGFGDLFPLAVTDGAIPANSSQNGSGFLGGLTLGYNFQSGSFVIGVEGDWMWADLSDTSSVTTHLTTPPFNYPAITTATETKTDWLATVRGRVGILAFPQTLLYATGGLAVGHVKGSTSITPVPCSANAFCSTGSGSETKAGWTIGGGAEYLFASNWTAKIEYLYYDLGTFSYTANEISPAFPTEAGKPQLNIDTRITGSIVRAGVNYKF